MKIGFCSLLGIIFIVLKILGIINWSWALVLLPIWLPVMIYLILFIVFMFIS